MGRTWEEVKGDYLGVGTHSVVISEVKVFPPAGNEINQVSVTFTGDDERTIRNDYRFFKKDGTPNLFGAKAFERLLKLHYGDNLKEWDENELVGDCYEITVEESEYNGKMYTNVKSVSFVEAAEDDLI